MTDSIGAENFSNQSEIVFKLIICLRFRVTNFNPEQWLVNTSPGVLTHYKTTCCYLWILKSQIRLHSTGQSAVKYVTYALSYRSNHHASVPTVDSTYHELLGIKSQNPIRYIVQ